MIIIFKGLEEKKIVTDFIEAGLNQYKNLIKPDNLEGCYDRLNFYPDAKLRFDCEIVEVANTCGWNYLNSGYS